MARDVRAHLRAAAAAEMQRSPRCQNPRITAQSADFCARTQAGIARILVRAAIVKLSLVFVAAGRPSLFVTSSIFF